jgi:hypothetical protein
VKNKIINFLAKGTNAQIVLLVLLTFFLVTASSVIVYFFTNYNSFFDTIWDVTTWVLDPGTFSGNIGISSRIISLVITLSGVLLMSTLIGILSAGLTDKMIELRNYGTPITNKNYTLILGWNYRVYNIINELIEAYDGISNHSVIILSEESKVEKDQSINRIINLPKNFNIQSRQFDPFIFSSYSILDIKNAKSIIITQNNKNEFILLKTLLMLEKVLDNKYDIPIVFEVDSKTSTSIITPVLKSNHYLIDKSRIFILAISQTTLQKGLSTVYEEIFSFRGSEIYFKPANSFVNLQIQDAIINIYNASIIGIYRDKKTYINPDKSFIIANGDEFICIMEDDSDLKIKKIHNNFKLKPNFRLENLLEFNFDSLLIIGWNQMGFSIVEELTKYISKKTQINIYTDNSISHDLKSLNPSLINFHVVNKKVYGNETLDQINFRKFSNILLLSDDRYNDEEADTITISTLLTIKNSIKQLLKSPKITIQIKIDKNKELIQEDDLLEFVVSDSLIGGIMSQVSENPKIYDTINELLNEWGNEIYFLDLNKLTEDIFPLNIIDAFKICNSLNSSMIGYKVAATQNIVINPIKTSNFKLSINDQLILIGDN